MAVPVTQLGPDYYESHSENEGKWFSFIAGYPSPSAVHHFVAQAIYSANDEQEARERLDGNMRAGLGRGGFAIPSPGPAGSRAIKLRNPPDGTQISLYAIKGRYLAAVSVSGPERSATPPSSVLASRVLGLLLARIPG